MTTTPSAAPSVQWLEISADQAGQRIDNFLLTRLKGAPRSLIYRILRSGEVRVNKGRIKPEYRLKAGDQLRLPPLRLPALGAPEALSKGLLERLEAAIVFEESGLIALNKPCGIAVHGGSGLSYGVIEALRQLRPDCKALELVHRLDRDTSGLLLIAKKRSLLRHLHQALRGELAAGQVDKRYLALLQGDFPASLKQIDAPLLKNTLHSGERMVQVQHQGKPALTRFSIVQRFAKLATLVEARPITGRTHQIRVHARHAGHPIAGDDKYGNADFSAQIRALGGKRLFLHAWRLRLPLPEGGTLELEAAPDAPWQHCLQRLSEQASSN